MNNSTFRGYFVFANLYSPLTKRKERKVVKFKTAAARSKWIQTHQDADPVYASAHQVNKFMGF